MYVLQEMTSEALRRVVVEYIKAVMQKRITFKNADERREGAERMIKEAEQFKFLFKKLAAVSRNSRLVSVVGRQLLPDVMLCLSLCRVKTLTVSVAPSLPSLRFSS